MDDFVWLAVSIIGAAVALFGIGYWRDCRNAKRQQEEQEREAEANRLAAKFQAQRERFHRERMSMAPIRTFATTAPTAKATVIKMRKDQFGNGGPSSDSSNIADALILQSMLSTRYLDGNPEPVTGKGGTFDGGGSSGDWERVKTIDTQPAYSSSCSSSSDSGSSSSSSYSSSDSSSSSSSDSGSSSCGGGD